MTERIGLPRLRSPRIPLLAAVFLALALFAAFAPARPTAALDDQETAFLAIINDYRAANGLGSLSLNTWLGDSSRWMSNDMASKNYWPDATYCAQFGQGAHCDSLGRDPFQRMADFGYTYNTWKGENLAAGADTAQGAFELWRNSPGHNANMLRAEFTVIGIARAYGPGTTYGWYWTTDFGGQGDPPPPADSPPPPPPAPPVEVAQASAPAEVTPPPPAPTPEATPAPTPAPAPSEPQVRQLPGWQTIASELSPWLAELGVDGSGDSILRTLSYMAERYLVTSSGLLAQEFDESRPDLDVSDVASGNSWPLTFSY